MGFTLELKIVEMRSRTELKIVEMRSGTELKIVEMRREKIFGSVWGSVKIRMRRIASCRKFL